MNKLAHDIATAAQIKMTKLAFDPIDLIAGTGVGLGGAALLGGGYLAHKLLSRDDE